MNNSTVLYSNKLKSSDYVLLLLSLAYMLHNSPYLGVRMPSMLFAGIIILLFNYACILFSRYKNVMRYLLPIFCLFFLDIIVTKIPATSGTEGLLRLISGSLQILVLPILAEYAIIRRNIKLAFCLLAIFLSIELITFITSTMAELEISGIIRLNPGQLRSDDEQMYALKTGMNVGNFDTVYGCATLIPIAVLVVKWRTLLFDKYVYRFLSILITAFFLYFVYVSQFTIAFVGALLMSLTLLCPKVISPQFFRRTIIFGVIAFIASITILPTVLHAFASNIESQIMAERFKGIAILLEGGHDTESLDIEARQQVYNEAITTISETYMIGGWKEGGSGGHSFILDHIALYGFLGILLLFVYYKGILKLFYQPYKNQPWIYYYLYGLIVLSFYYLFNPSVLYPQVLFCYPLSAFLINYKLQTK